MPAGTNIPFFKFSATGNDFILFDNRERIFTGDEVDFFRKICERRMSVGADGVLLIERHPDYDFRMRYINADGSETACGNGARSAAYFAHHQGWCGESVSFVAGDDVVEVLVRGRTVKLKMPEPRDYSERPGVLEESGWHEGGFINTGVPHYVLFGRNVAHEDVLPLGQKYRSHPHFRPDGTNVDFVEVDSPDLIRVRTYERGVENETLSCGTGCVASAILSNVQGKTGFPITVLTPGGELKVLKDATGRYLLEGEVTLVFEGKLTDRRRE